MISSLIAMTAATPKQSWLNFDADYKNPHSTIYAGSPVNVRYDLQRATCVNNGQRNITGYYFYNSEKYVYQFPIILSKPDGSSQVQRLENKLNVLKNGTLSFFFKCESKGNPTTWDSDFGKNWVVPVILV